MPIKDSGDDEYEVCITQELANSLNDPFVCLSENCCQALCANGTRCQNRPKYTLNLSDIPMLGGVVSKYLCSNLKLMPLKESEGCCRVCKVHFKKSSIEILKYAGNRLCIYLVQKVNEEIRRQAGLPIKFPEEEFEEANNFAKKYLSFEYS
jgi:hypothetical protein